VASLLRKVKSRLFIRSRRHAFHQLDGQYQSRARGRGMDFDDLREYAPGDDVRDIDWNATARGSATLIRRYKSERKQVVLFLVDTGRSMSAVTRTQETKREVAIGVVGAMAYLATKHGDDVGLLFGDPASPRRIPLGRSDSHLERMLQAIETAVTPSAQLGDMGALLAYAGRTARRGTILVCVADEAALTEQTSDILGSLRPRHEILWLSIGDSELAFPRALRQQPVLDVAARRMLPPFVSESRGVRAEARRTRDQQRQTRAAALDRAGVSHATVHSVDDVLTELVALFSRRGYARG
jgi:uncharacterized protein (DUF58 family)